MKGNEMVVLTNPIRKGGKTEKVYDELLCLLDAVYDSIPASEAQKRQDFDSTIRQPARALRAQLDKAIAACGDCVAPTGDWFACYRETQQLQCLLLGIADAVRLWGTSYPGNTCKDDARKVWNGIRALEMAILQEANDILSRFPQWQGKAASGGMSGAMPYIGIGAVVGGLILGAGMLAKRRRRG